jgi:hypothetical protein
MSVAGEASSAPAVAEDFLRASTCAEHPGRLVPARKAAGNSSKVDKQRWEVEVFMRQAGDCRVSRRAWQLMAHDYNAPHSQTA